ncbi:MAG: tRNA pseudouridine synthase A [Desulfurococcales archaeon]|nr:tRNA pseudouridine synthase A [Desulfurococcales archaeon]MEB3773096.1 tRNA pseudouridine synthase A [Desulfurococcales archaeon]MEB3798884.1 tRNA pseudouridine synthase A [Desulfurococcales archaeon]
MDYRLRGPGWEFIKEISEFCGDKREWIIVRDEETDYSYGKIPSERSLEELLDLGVINLDKPPGPTSHEVVAWIKRMFGLKKAGHGGTLEGFA